MGPPKKDKDEEQFSFGATMDAEGKLEGRDGPPAARRTPGRALEQRMQALELVERPPPPTSDYVPPPAVRVRLWTPYWSSWLTLLTLVVLAAGLWLYFARSAAAPAHTRAAAAVVILITSDPVGATVSVEGTVVGVTPWAVDNTWAPGPVNVTLTHPGYRPWTGTFQGGRPSRLEARLQRR